MAQILPFEAIRPEAEEASAFSVSAYESEDREGFLKPHDEDKSYLQVLLPQLFFDGDISEEERYRHSREAMQRFLREHIALKDEKPCLYIYRQIKGNNVFTAFIGLASLEDYNNDLVKKHELTIKDKEEKLARYFREVGINGMPVLLTYPEHPNLSEYVRDVLVMPAPVYHFTSADDIEHMVWKIEDEEQVKKVQSYFSEVKALYIADGHHRSAALQLLYPDLKYFLACFIPDSLIRIHAFHRYVTKLGMPVEAFLDKLSESFTVERHEIPKFPATQPGVIYMFAANQWYRIEIPESLKRTDNPRQNLDVYILDRHIFGDILNIENTRTSKQVQFINGEPSGMDLLSPVKMEQKEALFVLHPVEAEEVMRVSDVGETMPPKSTWIEPKLRSGLLIHQFKNLLNL